MANLPLLESLLAEPSFAQALEGLRSGQSRELSLTTGLRPAVVAALAFQDAAPCLVVSSGGAQAATLVPQLRNFLGGRVVSFPAWETLLHEPLSPSPRVVAERAATLRSIRSDSVVVVSTRALLQPVFPSVAECVAVELEVDRVVDRDRLLFDLVASGYERVDLVERRGEFAVRGSIVDVFGPSDEHPTRLEFDIDELIQMRAFSVADQRSLETQTKLVLMPCVEERTGAPKSLVELLPDRLQAFLFDPERISARAQDLQATDEAFRESDWQASFGETLPINSASDSAYFDLQVVADQVSARRGQWVGLTPFLQAEPGAAHIVSEPSQRFRGNTKEFCARASEWLAQGWQVVVVLPGSGSIARMNELLQESGLPTVSVGENSDASITSSQDLSRVALNLWQGQWADGFVLPDARVIWLSESDLFGKSAAMRQAKKMPSRRKGALDPLTLKQGEWVVHYQHGVGRFQEVATRQVGPSAREYLVVEYAPSRRNNPPDLLYVPTDQLHMITKYIGGEKPSLNRLGGGEWQKTKARARKAVRDIADQLIKLYATRSASKGAAFSADTPWQRELEEAFVHVETADQLVCIQEVKDDMEKPMPMDRVIAGDVGYGKTEIAIRAAFKAVQDGKQVAVLVPTTLLVQQHFATFSERYANFPVTVAALSRFQSDKEANQTLDELAKGSVDVIIGTHRLLTPKVKFRDLGLVIVDEEQRFGVEHKEFLKALRANVDVLTLSATPIPRTLEMAITGIRDLSVIQTPPEERLPVHTYVGPYDEGQVAAAIRRELVRDGQVFFVHNRVETIDQIAARVAELVPEARVAVALGQMSEASLEQVIIDFWDAKYDVLVCTTIVESGLDIANANTLIVDSAERLGLAQLHQLRGRVGRSNERAHAYFFYSPRASLSETAYERLSTIAQHNELGAGMAVAMKDLEIRGAGNLLGGQQSGHIAEVGFDLYVRLVSEALAEAKGEAQATTEEIRIDLPLVALLPTTYIAEERLRLDAYRRLADVSTDEEVDALVDLLRHRFGSLPIEAETLCEVAKLRNLVRSFDLREVSSHAGAIRMSPLEIRESNLMRIQRLHPGARYRNATKTLIVPTDMVTKHSPQGNQQLLSWLRSFLLEEVGSPIAA